MAYVIKATGKDRIWYYTGGFSPYVNDAEDSLKFSSLDEVTFIMNREKKYNRSYKYEIEEV